MTIFSKIIFFGFFVAIFLFEGLGLVDREWALLAVYLMPFFLALPLFFQNKPLYFPKKISLLFFLLLFFSFLSLFFSVNIERSFYFLIYYLSVFLIFVYVYNFKNEIAQGVVFFSFVLAFIFLFDALLLGSSFSKNFSFLIPKRDYQFVYQVYPTHHPLGIFLIIPFSLLIVPLVERGAKKYFLLTLVFLPALIFSYFRSSYLAFIIIVSWLVFKKWISQQLSLKRLISLSILVIFLSLILLSLGIYQKPVFLLSDINQFLRNNFHLSYKNFFSARDEYWLAAIKGFTENPLFGFGLGNFFNLSLKFTQSGAVADSSSLFLDFFAETGFFGGMVFFLIFLIIAFSGRNILNNKESLLTKMVYVSFLTLFVFFQSGPGKHYSLILTFFVLGALIYQEEENLNLNGLFFFLLLIVVFVFQSMMMSRLYLKFNHYLLAFYRFPFQKAVYQPLIENLEKKGEMKQADRFSEIYAKFFSGESDSLNYIAERYEKKVQREKAFSFYERSFEWSRFQSFSLIEKIYRFKKELTGDDEANHFVKKFLSEYYFLRYQYYWPDFERAVQQFCRKEKFTCQL